MILLKEIRGMTNYKSGAMIDRYYVLVKTYSDDNLATIGRYEIVAISKNQERLLETAKKLAQTLTETGHPFFDVVRKAHPEIDFTHLKCWRSSTYIYRVAYPEWPNETISYTVTNPVSCIS